MSDEGAERELLKAVFTRHGARVTAAYSTAEAVALMKRKAPDIIVADYRQQAIVIDVVKEPLDV